MSKWIVVAIGGALGAMARYGLTGWLNRFSDRLPYGTFLVNVTGSFLIGLILAYSFFAHEVDPRVRVFLTTGFLGAFTTFSTFSYETLELLANGGYAMAGLNVGLNLVLGLLAVWLGTVVGKVL